MPRKKLLVKRTHAEELKAEVFRLGHEQRSIGLYPKYAMRLGPATFHGKSRRNQDWGLLQRHIAQAGLTSEKLLLPGTPLDKSAGPNPYFLRVTSKGRKKANRIPIEGKVLDQLVKKMPELKTELRKSQHKKR